LLFCCLIATSFVWSFLPLLSCWSHHGFIAWDLIFVISIIPAITLHTTDVFDTK
jgi:hypothetical protein